MPKMFRSLALLAPFAVMGGTTTVGVVTVAAAETSEDPSSRAAARTLADLPVAMHRRAAELLEERRDRDDSPWVQARLRADVVPMFRPGESDPTYAEVTVEDADGAPLGFMVLSTGEHDHPLVHLAYEGLAPSERLRLATGNHDVAHRFYRLSYDAYVAEDAAGDLVAVEGHLPGKVSGYDPSWLDLPQRLRAGTYRWDPEHGVQQQPAKVGAGIRFDAWGSWRELKEQYVANYADLHELDRRNASDDWEVERTLANNGETLQNGEFRELPLLAGRGVASYTVRGGGRAAVRTELAERSVEGDMALRVFVDTAPVRDVAPVDIDVQYADGTSETLRLNVTDRMPTRELGTLAAPSATAGTVRVRVRAQTARRIGCSKAVLMTQYGSAVRLVGNELKTTGPWRTDDALVRIEYSGHGEVAFRASNNRYVRAVGGGGGDVRADASAKGSHERFTLYASRGDSKFYGLQTADGRHFVDFSWTGEVNARTTRSQNSKFTVDYCQPRRIFVRWAGKNVGDVAKKVRKYDQLEGNQAPSTSGCASGCGGTAWGMLFGFHDYEAALGDAKWVTHKRLYSRDGRASGPDATAPEWFWPGHENRLSRPAGTAPHLGAAAMVWEIAQVMNDWALAGCSASGQKWTAPVEMGKAHIYLDRRGVNAKMISDYDGAGIMTHEGKTKAYAVIKRKQPVIIGIGHLSHYPLAVGRDRTEYRVWERDNNKWSDKADRRNFVVSMGWGRSSLDVVPYDTWLQGSLDVPEAVTAVTTVNAKIDPPKPAKTSPLKTNKNLNPKKTPIGGKIPTPNW